MTWRGWCQPLRPNSSWIEQVKTCPCLTQLEERRRTIPRPSVPFQIKHHGTGAILMDHLSTVSSGQKWDLSKFICHDYGRESQGSALDPGCLLFGKYLLSTSCVLQIASIFLVTCCTFSPSSSVSSLPLGHYHWSFVTLLTSLFWGAFSEPLPPRTQPSFNALSESSRALCGCLCHSTDLSNLLRSEMRANIKVAAWEQTWVLVPAEPGGLTGPQCPVCESWRMIYALSSELPRAHIQAM